MAKYDYDLFVIGGGSGGLATAKRAASYGAKVAIAEADRVGGTCVIRGCIPKKLMVYAAHYAHVVEDSSGYGWRLTAGGHDWGALVKARDEAVLRLERTHERLLAEVGVELIRGRAELEAPGRISLGGRVIESRSVLVATGSEPVFPKIDGIEHAISSDGFFLLKERPDRVAIVGGGYIAVEFASMLAGLGARVTIVFRRDLPLRGFDEDIRSELKTALQAAGVDVRSQTTVERIERFEGGLVLSLDQRGSASRLAVDDALVYATGRRPRVSGLGLEKLGARIGDAGELLVDDGCSTTLTGVFAVGDVTGRFPLTPVAIQQGRALADRLFGGKSTEMSYEFIPTAVFTDPPIATVGLTEGEALELYGRDGVRVFRSRFTPLLHALTERKAPVLMKLVVKADDDRVVGCHMMGYDAPEIVQGFAVAMKGGATKALFDATVGIHPSSAEEFLTLN